MIELLELCGFEEEELKKELPRIETAFNKLGITAEDIEVGKQRLRRYYDVELKGIRKTLRLLIKNLINTVMAKEDGKTKIVYGFMIPGFAVFTSALVSKYRDVHAEYILPQFQIVLGAIFNKMTTVLEAAEGKWLKAGAVYHCGNVKGLVGLLTTGMLPRPDLLITSGLLCETAPKTIDLLHEVYGLSTCTYDACCDRESKEYADATKRLISLAAKSLRMVTAKIKDEVGVEITDDMLRETMDARKGLIESLGKIQDLVGSSDPMPLRSQDQFLLDYLFAFTFSIEQIPEVIDVLNVLYEELQERVDKGVGVTAKGAPRILAVLPSHHTDPSQDATVNELGMSMVSAYRILTLPDTERPDDPYEQMVWEETNGLLFQSLDRRIDMIAKGCKRLNMNGVLDHYHVGCRTVTGDAFFIKEAVAREPGIPALLQLRDDFDGRLHDHEQFKRSLKVFKDMIS